MKNLAQLLCASALIFSACKKNELVTPENPNESQTISKAISIGSDQPFIDGEVIVKFKHGIPENRRVNALQKVSGKIKEKILTKMMEKNGDNEGIVLITTSLSSRDAVSKLKNESDVEYAEPNYIYTHDATTSDPYFTNGYMWGVSGTYGSRASQAWNVGHTGSASVYVGIIDEGVQASHPDLQGQIWTNPFDPVDGRDNDGNGFIDDVNGWDFAANNNSVYDGGTGNTIDNHGTHVAGTIGAKANTQGVVGVNWNVTIIATKFMSANGGTTANAIKAIDYLNDLKTRHNLNIVATNNSWGGSGYSQALYDAINRANARNILFIAAAGNGGTDGVGDNNETVANYPSNYNLPNIIAVAAITNTGARASFSNYGLTSVDIGAPGQSILSTVTFNSYAYYSGTSMATPHVTGAAALYKSTHPSATAAQIKTAILSTATPTTSLAGKCVTGGRLNVASF